MEISRFLPIWDKLKKEEQEALLEHSWEQHYEKGALIRTGDECTGIILIRSGQLRVYTVSEDGREITMYRLFDRDICLFTASCMMRSIQFDMTVAAEKDTDAIVICPDVYKNAEALRRFIAQQPVIL